MSRGRQTTVPVSDWTDEDLGMLPSGPRLLAVGLRWFADDRGRESVNALRIKAALFPLDEAVTPTTIDDWLIELGTAGWLAFYSLGAKTYFQIVTVPRVDRPSGSRIPDPPTDILDDPREWLASDSRAPREPLAALGGRGNEGDGNGLASRADRVTLPSPFCPEHPGGSKGAPCRLCGDARMHHQHILTLQRREASDEDDLGDGA